MDYIEFLKRTDHRNLMYNIDFLVQQKLRDYNFELEERRKKLGELLKSESQQYEYELNALQAACDADKEARRLEWIGLMRLQKEREEKELIKLKKQQRELENSEEYKHMRSREMLLDFKQAQLYQIEEQKILKEKQRRTERDWLEAMQKFNAQQSFYDFKAQKLRKCIADVDQAKNLQLKATQAAENAAQKEELRQYFASENNRATFLNQKYKQAAEFYEWRKKVYQKDVLERQIHDNAVENAIERQNAQVNANLERRQIQQTILEEIDKKAAQVVKNRAVQEKYLENISKEKKEIAEKEKELVGLVAGKSCVLQQKEKRPYSKQTR